MPEPAALFWDRVDLREPVFNADEWARLPAALRGALVEAGILERTANARQVACDACDTGHIEKVFDVPSPDGSRRFYIQCPENGRVPVEEERLFRWAVNLDALVGLAAGLLGATGGLEQLVPGRVWAAGRLVRGGVSRKVIIARGLTWVDASAVVTASQHVRVATPPLVLVIGRAPTEDLWGSKVPTVVPLEQVLHLGPTAAVRMETLDETLGAEVLQPARGKRKARRSGRAATIDRLTDLLRAHLRAARDHAHTLVQRRRPPELLPRPTQAQLARQAGATEATVSRCLADANAKELRILWHAAEDIEQVMSFKG